jgi:hypothetical protein
LLTALDLTFTDVEKSVGAPFILKAPERKKVSVRHSGAG